MFSVFRLIHQALRLALLLATLTLAALGVAQSPDLKALEGEWIYVEDRTEGRALEQLGPPMSSKFSFRVEADAVILARGHGGGHKDVRVALSGSVTEVPDPQSASTARYSGSWKDGTFTYQTLWVPDDATKDSRIYHKEFRMTPDGLEVKVTITSSPSVAIYRKAEDIPMPTPFAAKISDLGWLAGAWTGTRGSSGTTTIEERWSPPKGGSMFAISRTVAKEKLSAFEYLRIIERDGGLVYIAQPNGAPPTEFILTELTGTKAVFDNPRHDYPKRIVYELGEAGALSATIGFLKGGSPRKFAYKKESS